MRRWCAIGWLGFTKYLTDPGVARLETEAKASHIGLWRDPRARPLWSGGLVERKSD